MTAKFKTANIFVGAGITKTAKFDARQYFCIYGKQPSCTDKGKGLHRYKKSRFANQEGRGSVWNYREIICTIAKKLEITV